ncbi:MAG: M48 family metalloprotease [Acidobacteriales bacterium]|nr:M48 family metalloprotease [Terriglobales bacterium]
MKASTSIGSRALALVLVALMIAPPGAFARQQVLQGADAISVEQEIQLGQQAAQQTRQKEQVIPDNSEITQYVRHLGQSLVSVAPGDKWPFEFHVINTKDVNAFALPGGPMFINIGAIMMADHENELAGVMAHEMSHVIDRHATRAYTKQQKYQVGLGILGAVLGGRGGLGQIADLGAQFAVGSYFLKNSRTAESQADLLGTDIMHDAGYDPRGLADFFGKLEEVGNRGPQFLSDHPDPGNRRQAVIQEMNSLQPRQYRGDSAEWIRIKQMVGSLDRPGSGVPAGSRGGQQEQPQELGDAGNIRPSSTLQTLNHNLYSVQYPSNWQVMGDPSSDVTIAPEGGVAQNQQGQAEVAYGVMISGFEPEQRGGSALDDGTHELIDQLRQGNQDMRQAGSEENIKVNGMPGKSIEFTSRSPLQGQKERDWLVTVERPDNSILYLVFVAPDRDFRSLRPTFERMLRSVHLR